ncbi:pejvakin-like isoform X2 [Lytechinus pictus]|uniref:pejvakin-like isoform X2 n=1 Tax=Lytechinus pictus TaxID=7653 RepID=UPI0030B9B16D
MSLFYKHSIFNQATGNFVHSVSSRALSNLVPSPSLSDAGNCHPYHLVVKKNKKYFWNKVRLYPTPFTLSDIVDGDLTDNAFDEVNPTKKDLVNFERTLTIEAKGKLEASLAMEVAGFELDGNHRIEVSVDFGQIAEKSLDIPELVNSVKGRKVNLRNDFIKEVMSTKRNTLCLVVTTLSTEAESKITTDIQTSGSADGNVTGSAHSVSLETSLSNDRKRSIEIPSNTPLAFRMLEILVKADRSIQLMQLPDSEGGFMTIKDDERGHKPKYDHLTPRGDLHFNVNAPVRDIGEIRDQLKAMLSLPDQDLKDVRQSLTLLLKHPIQLDSLNIMLQVALNALLVGEGGKQTTWEMMKEKLGCPDLNDIKPYLQVAGFSFEKENIVFPTGDESNILVCTSYLVDLMGSLNEDQGRILFECSEEEKRSIIKVLAETLTAGRLPLDQPIVSDLFAGSRRAECLVFSLGLQLERTGGDWFLSYHSTETKEDDLSPYGLLVIMCALWD